MAVKEANKLPSQTTLSNTDSFVVHTQNGLKRITKENLMMDLFFSGSPYQSLYNKWVRFAKVTTNGGWMTGFGLFVFSTGWSAQHPIATPVAVCVYGIPGGGSSLDGNLLINTSNFPSLRLTELNGVRYVEVLVAVNNPCLYIAASSLLKMELLPQAIILDNDEPGLSVKSTLNLSPQVLNGNSLTANENKPLSSKTIDAQAVNGG